MSEQRQDRFTVETTRDGDVVIFDDDFGWDATIKVVGDFYGPDKKWFLEAICAALNHEVSNIPTRDNWEKENPELARRLMG